MGLYLGLDIDLKDTLLVFDEIQLCPPLTEPLLRLEFTGRSGILPVQF